MKNNTALQQLSLLSLFASFMLIVGWVEKMLPLVPSMPAVRLGLANVFLLLAFVFFGAKKAWYLLFIKIFLGGILFLGPLGMLYTGVGSVLSLLSLQVASRWRLFSFIGLSMFASLMHIVGQLLINLWLVGFWGTMAFAPFLLITSLISGFGIGYLAQLLIKNMHRNLKLPYCPYFNFLEEP